MLRAGLEMQQQHALKVGAVTAPSTRFGALHTAEGLTNGQGLTNGFLFPPPARHHDRGPDSPSGAKETLAHLATADWPSLVSRVTPNLEDSDHDHADGHGDDLHGKEADHEEPAAEEAKKEMHASDGDQGQPPHESGLSEKVGASVHEIRSCRSGLSAPCWQLHF
jgi:hypothetical protein